MTSIGISLIWFKDEYPVPKSSRATRTPRCLISARIRFMRLISLTARLSVTSRVRFCGVILVSSITRAIRSTISFCKSCTTDRLTFTLYSGCPISFQYLQWIHASRRTNSPIGLIRPKYSASGMKSAGGIRPSSPEFQRISASAPAHGFPSFVIFTIGWKYTSNSLKAFRVALRMFFSRSSRL